MAALAPYIPPRDTDFSAWLLNFSTLITASPSTYGLLSSDAVTIAALYASWLAAYTPVTSPSTRTAALVSAKNTVKVTVLSQVRVYAQQISLNPGVASGDKTALGVNPRTSTPSPVTPATTNPVLMIQYGGMLALAIRYRDSAASPSVKSKPYGSIACQVRYAVSTTPVTDVTLLTGLQVATKSPFIIQFAPADGGKQCYLAARWQTRTGGYSPWSPVINFTVPTGA
jgi:hypothetical protein